MTNLNNLNGLDVSNILVKSIFPKDTLFLNICHFNAQSLEANNKIDEFRSTFLDTNVHLIGVSETWFTSATNSSLVSLKGY